MLLQKRYHLSLILAGLLNLLTKWTKEPGQRSLRAFRVSSCRVWAPPGISYFTDKLNKKFVQYAGKRGVRSVPNSRNRISKMHFHTQLPTLFFKVKVRILIMNRSTQS